MNKILKDIPSQKTIYFTNNVPLYENKNISSNSSLTILNSLQNQNNNEKQIEKCKICNKTENLIKCQYCKSNYHSNCLNLNDNESNFLCPNCKQKLLKVSEKLKEEKKIKNKNPKKEKKEVFKSTNYKIGNKRKRDKEKQKEKEKEITKQKNTKNKKEEKKNINANKTKNNINNNIPINNINIKESKKRRSNKSNNPIDLIKKERESFLLLSYNHTNPQYKRRKIKIGINHQCDINEYKEKYENEINFDEEEYERNQLKQIWSVSKNPFSNEEIDKYLRTARLFWNYRNLNIENELCCDYFEECDKILKKKNLSEKLKKKINQLIKELRELIRRGIDLNCHYDEMSLKMLYLCNFKMKVALFFLYKQLNPFIEEVEEGFKSDVLIFQNELFSMINDGDFYEPDE